MDSDHVTENHHLQKAMDSPVTASLGPAGPLLRQLSSLTVSRREGTAKDEIQKLREDLGDLCVSLMHQSEAEEPPSPTAKWWMSEVREICYDTKDYFDDHQFISNQDDDDARLEFNMLKARANHANERRKRYQNDQHTASTSNSNKPKLGPVRRRLPKLIDCGRMDEVAALLRKDEEKLRLKAVSLVGPEGVGKTTLAKRVYRKIKTDGQFECGAFVRVSPNPDMRRLLTSLFIQIQSDPPFSSSEGASQPPCCLDAQALITNIAKHLQYKRYFIIIDDLWSISVWDIIRRSFPDGDRSSRIIISTQFMNVASACFCYESNYIFEVKPLESEQAQKLFVSMVFDSEDKVSFPEGFGKVPSEIIEKCGGLPLSMVNIVNLLPTEESAINLQLWIHIRDTLTLTLGTDPTSVGMAKVINLIYNNLSPELKTCLLYLAVYPEGYTSNKDDLVKQWVTEGFTGEGENKVEIAREYFDELISRGMIQTVDINYRGVLSCTLHHMVHDLIVNRSIKENFIMTVDYFNSAIGFADKVRRLSVQFGGARSASIPAGIMLSEVRTLAFFGFYKCAHFIEECKLLRVLILHVWADKDEVPFDISVISKIFPLRYVKIACNIAVNLPAKIQDLQFLETLELDTPVVDIPSDIGDLSRLSSLKIAVTELSREDIPNLQKLPALTTLSLHVCTTPVKMIVFDKEGFLVLKSFKFRCHLPWLKFEEGSMPGLENLNLCFNAREADQRGIVPTGMEHLSGLKEITAHIWGSDTDVGSTFRNTISNHPSNPRIHVQFVDPIFHGDTTTSVGTFNVEDEKKQSADIRMSTLTPSKRMSTLLGSSLRVPVQGAEKKLKMETETDGIEVKGDTFAYGREEMAHGMSKLKIKNEDIDDKMEKKFDIPQDMDIEHWTSASPMKTGSIDDKLQTKFDILEDKDIEHWMPSSRMKNWTDMNWQPAECEDEKKLADIRMCATPGSSSRVPDSGAEKTSKLKIETDNFEIKAEVDFDCVDDKVVEPRMTTNPICQFEFVKLFQWTRSAISSQYSGLIGSREQQLQGEVLELEKRLHGLRDTLPNMYDLINAAEWRSYEYPIADILPNLKDAVYDAEDLLDEFKWYELKVTVEGNANQCPFSDFFNDVIRGSFNEKVQCMQDRLDDLLNQLEKMGLHEGSYESVSRFDKSVRPETAYLINESEIFGRDMELKKVIGFLTKTRKSSGAHSKRKSTNKNNDETKIPGFHVLPIVGIGGVGKTCLAQHVCNHPDIRSHFNLIIWLSVSDDFDVMTLTKQALESFSGERPTSDDLDILQHALSVHVRDKKVLIILDDLWGDALKEDSKYWNIFCAPLENIGQKSLMLVTTRSPKVADSVRTMRSFTLKSLKNNAIQDFFKQCIFGSESSNSDPNLQPIGKIILAKLNGSPLAAKTVGLLLRMVLENTCISAKDKALQWNYVLESELWELTQKMTDILPSLQLSYMHLPLHLKRCFAFCAVYPKDKSFQKESLAEIWVAEGFVEPEGKTPAKDIACQYFEELVNESFFQKVSWSYKIPPLLHDMAKLVSKNDCFVIRKNADFEKVPRDVRHLSILSGSGEDFDHANLLSLRKHTRLRTLLYNDHWKSKDISAVIDHWCSGLHRLRVMCCASTDELPDSIGHLKHLRYLEISRACPLNSLPSAFCYLYSLQIVHAEKCKLEAMCCDLSNLISLRRFRSHGFDYSPGCVLEIDMADWQGLGLGLIKNVSDVKGLRLLNLGKMSKNQAAELELKNKQRLNSLKLGWGEEENDDRQVLQVLEPPTSLKSLILNGYGGVSLPSWFGPQNLPRLTSLTLYSCDGLESMSLAEGTSLARVSQPIDLNEMRVDSNKNKDTTGIFSSLTELTISKCGKLSSLEQLMQPAYIPAIKKITIENCKSLAWAGSFVDFRCLEDLEVHQCPNINSQCLVAPSLKRLRLGRFPAENIFSFGNLGDNIDCCSLANFVLRCDGITSIQLENWNLPALRELEILFCPSLTSIGQSVSGTGGRFSSLTSLSINSCEELSAIDNLLSEEYLPVIQKIWFRRCSKLLSLPVEIGSLSSLRCLEITDCPSIRWPSGFVFPSSLEWLELRDSGDMSACVPSCLDNLTSLVSLTLERCPGITVIPEKVWSSIRKSLQQLRITECPDLVSIGIAGASAIRNLKAVIIDECPKMEDIKQPRKKGSFLPKKLPSVPVYENVYTCL